MNIKTKKIDNFEMSLNLADGGISRTLYTVGYREKAFMQLLQDTVQEGDVCIDLGSNIGYTTLYMSEQVGKTGYVYAIEPDPQSLSLLRKNIEQNNFSDRCEIIQCAISDKDGKLDFWQASRPNLSSVHKTAYSTNKLIIDAYSLESFLSNRRYPNFIKMDVEGHEVKIFEGALNYFSNNWGRTSFLVEVHPNFYNKDNDFAAVLEQFFEIGFNTKFVVSTPIAQPAMFSMFGYKPITAVSTDGFVRGIYNNISNSSLLEFACKEHYESGSKKIVRSFMIEREE